MITARRSRRLGTSQRARHVEQCQRHATMAGSRCQVTSTASRPLRRTRSRRPASRPLSMIRRRRPQRLRIRIRPRRHVGRAGRSGEPASRRPTSRPLEAKSIRPSRLRSRSSIGTSTGEPAAQVNHGHVDRRAGRSSVNHGASTTAMTRTDQQRQSRRPPSRPLRRSHDTASRPSGEPRSRRPASRPLR